VDQLVTTGIAEPFSPSRKRFREWAATPVKARDRWEQILHDALDASARRRCS
jgi:hypothetical protein